MMSRRWSCMVGSLPFPPLSFSSQYSCGEGKEICRVLYILYVIHWFRRTLFPDGHCRPGNECMSSICGYGKTFNRLLTIGFSCFFFLLSWFLVRHKQSLPRETAPGPPRRTSAVWLLGWRNMSYVVCPLADYL